MAEITQFEYSNKELVMLMLKDQGVHEGHWHLAVKLGFSALNLGEKTDGTDASPAGAVAFTGARIVRVPEPLPFSVNATEVNPKKPA
jgi:hypothetical protein